jgi:hypothetical protein
MVFTNVNIQFRIRIRNLRVTDPDETNTDETNVLLYLKEILDGLAISSGELAQQHGCLLLEEGALVVLLALGPLLSLRVEEVLASELLHYLLIHDHAKYAGIQRSHRRRRAHGAVVISVGDDNHVDVLDDALEGQVELLLYSRSSSRAQSILFMKRKGQIRSAMA